MKPYPWKYTEEDEDEYEEVLSNQERDWKRLMEVIVVGAVSVAVIALTHAH